jgi:XTP/dITP diphosphohydrolase
MQLIFVPTSNAGKLREFEHALSLQNIGCVGLNKMRDLSDTLFGWQNPVEDRQTFVGNNYQKLAEALRVFPKLVTCGVTGVLVDDSGLCVPRLNNLPGVHSATFAGEPRDDQRNRTFLIETLKRELKMRGDDKEPGFFVCSLLYAEKCDSQNEFKGHPILSPQGLLERMEKDESSFFQKALDRFGVSHAAVYTQRFFLQGQGQLFDVRLVMGFCLGFVGVQEQQLIDGEGHGYDAMFYPSARPELSFASIPLAEKNTMSHRSEALRGLIATEKSHTVPYEILAPF